jgi:hypothetical protein
VLPCTKLGLTRNHCMVLLVDTMPRRHAVVRTLQLKHSRSTVAHPKRVPHINQKQGNVFPDGQQDADAGSQLITILLVARSYFGKQDRHGTFSIHFNRVTML